VSGYSPRRLDLQPRHLRCDRGRKQRLAGREFLGSDRRSAHRCLRTNTGNTCDSVNNATIDGALAGYYSNVSSFLDPDGDGGDPPGGGCDNDGVCESGEDCTNCGDCDGRTGGRKSLRFCCGDGTAQSAEGNGSICDGNY